MSSRYGSLSQFRELCARLDPAFDVQDRDGGLSLAATEVDLRSLLLDGAPGSASDAAAFQRMVAEQDKDGTFLPTFFFAVYQVWGLGSPPFPLMMGGK